MAHLARAKKVDLLEVVKDLGLTAPDDATRVSLVEIITKSSVYNEELVKNLLAGVVKEREELEERERLKQVAEKEFELKKLEITEKNKIREIREQNPNVIKSPDVLKLISKYESSEEISIYLTLFERQIKRLGVEKEDWVTYLLGLLPLDIVNIISREREDKANDYDYIKQLLLKRFKLSPEQFRQKFFSHKKENAASWRDHSFELSNFLEEWLAGLGVQTLEDLKNILIIDQIRRKLPPEIKEHFVDEMPKFIKVEEFVNKLDEYETARNNIKKNTDSRNSNYDTKKRFIPATGEKNFPRNNEQQRNSYKKNFNDNGKTNPFKIRCFYCNQYSSHKSSECPLRRETQQNSRYKDSDNRNNSVAHDYQKKNIHTTLSSTTSEKIYKTVKIGNKNARSLIDTGSDVTMVSDNLYNALGRPNLSKNNVKLTGISGKEVCPMGYFNDDILIDDTEINSNVYVMNNLGYEMIIGNNCLSKLKFEISDDGMKVSGKRNDEKKKTVNLVTVAPLDSPNNSTMINIPTTNAELRLDSQNIPTPEKHSADKEKIQSIYLAETADSVRINEVELSHINNRAIKKEIIQLIENYKPAKTKTVDMKVSIILNDDVPVAQPPRRLAFAEQEFVNKQIDEWLEKGIIRESCSNYAAPIVLAKKKNGSLRLCVDYRKLNKKIIRDNYPLPLIDDILDSIEQNQVFSTLDLKNGFFHVEIAEDSKKYTSFVTNSAQFEYNFMPFGLSLAPQHFQRYIYACLRELIRDKTVLVYMDDIIVLARSEEEALMKLKRVFQVASEYGLEFNFAKCQFLQRKIEFLGYIVENGTIRPSETKTLAVKKFPEPQNKKQLQSFLGLTGYFRKYIENYAKIAKPLSDLLRAEKEFNFGPCQKEAFETLKNKLSSAPVLHIFRRGAETELHTDASSSGFGAVLLQKDDNNKLHPVHFMSRKTTPTQSKYSSYELEALAIVEALKKFRTYLLGTKFKIITDCSAFQKTLEKKDLVPKVARWALFLQEFDYQILHRSGNQMKHVDALSRNTALVMTRSQDELTYKLNKAQNEDEHIQTIKTLIEKNESQDYFIKNNIVYKYEAGRELIMVPEKMENEIIREIHNRGHHAVAKTEPIIKQQFYIPNLKKKIEKVIENCIECILCNRKRGKGEGFLNPIPKQSVPLHTYHIDHLGPMPSTNKNYNYIFSVVDAFTKFAWFYPVKTTSAKEVIAKLKLQQATFGNPAQIISDRGSAFISNDFENYLKEEKIKHTLITTGIPRGNGQVERLQGCLIPILTKLSIEDPTKWYKYVPTVQRILNSTCSRSTQYTPFELLVGVKLRGSEDLKIKQMLDEEYENAFVEERQSSRDIAKENILKIQNENRKNFDRKRKIAKTYQVGDLVAVQKTQFGVGAKLRPKFYGPYKILKVKKNNRYDVEKVGFQEGPRMTCTAADYMKPWASNI